MGDCEFHSWKVRNGVSGDVSEELWLMTSNDRDTNNNLTRVAFLQY